MNRPSGDIQQFLGFDWGKLRIGVASANTLSQTAQAIGTLNNQAGALLDKSILRLIQEWRPHTLVVGIPFYPDGKPHKNTNRAKEFARYLRRLTHCAVEEVDERYSTTEAKFENPQAREEEIDALSACIILEQYMRNLPT